MQHFSNTQKRLDNTIHICYSVVCTLNFNPSRPRIRQRMCPSCIPDVSSGRVLSESRAGRVEGTLCKSHPPSPLFSNSCKRVRIPLKTRTFKSLCFHTHAHSFAVSPVFATLTQNNPWVYAAMQIRNLKCYLRFRRQPPITALPSSICKITPRVTCPPPNGCIFPRMETAGGR